MAELIARSVEEYITHCEECIQELLSIVKEDGGIIEPESMRSIEYNILSYSLGIIRMRMVLIKNKHCAK